MAEETKNGTRREGVWERLLYVIVFVVIYSVGEVVLAAVVVVQFGFVLLSGRCNQNLLGFGAALSRFMYDVLRYFTFASDRKPFPFGDWPMVDEPSGDT